MSNRTRAGKHNNQATRLLTSKGFAKRTVLGGSMISLYAALHGKQARTNKQGRDIINSRPLLGWSDKVRKGDVPVGLHMPAMYLFSQLCTPAPIIKRVGPTKTFKALMWRDDKPSLFDDCLMVDPKNSDGASRSVIKPGTITTRATGVISRYHQPIGSLPEYKPTVRQPNAVKREADAAVEVWRAQRQLEHLEALTEWRR
jgi:hypothetical protein